MGKKAKEIFHMFSRIVKSEVAQSIAKIPKDLVTDFVTQCGLGILGGVLTKAIQNNDHFTDEEKTAKSMKVSEVIANFDTINKKTAEDFALDITDILFGDIDFEDDDMDAIKAKIAEIKYDITQIMNGNALYILELASDFNDLKEELKEHAEIAESYIDDRDNKLSSAAPAQAEEASEEKRDDLAVAAEETVVAESSDTQAEENTAHQDQNDTVIEAAVGAEAQNSNDEGDVAGLEDVALSNNEPQNDDDNATDELANVDDLSASVSDVALLGTDIPTGTE